MDQKNLNLKVFGKHIKFLFRVFCRLSGLKIFKKFLLFGSFWIFFHWNCNSEKGIFFERLLKSLFFQKNLKISKARFFFSKNWPKFQNLRKNFIESGLSSTLEDHFLVWKPSQRGIFSHNKSSFSSFPFYGFLYSRDVLSREILSLFFFFHSKISPPFIAENTLRLYWLNNFYPAFLLFFLIYNFRNLKQ